MTRVAMLNENTEAVIALTMVRHVEEKLRVLDAQLTTKVLEREAYLSAISRAIVLREVLQHHLELYRRSFEH